MRTVSAAELSRLSSARGAAVRMPMPEEPPAPAPTPAPAPAPPVNNDKLADAVLQLGSLLAGAIQSFRPPMPAAPQADPMWMPPAPQPQLQAPAMGRPELVTKFAVATDPDGLVLSVSAGGDSYTVTRDEDGLGTAIVRSGPSGSTTYRIYRGAGGRISSISLAAKA